MWRSLSTRPLGLDHSLYFSNHPTQQWSNTKIYIIKIIEKSLCRSYDANFPGHSQVIQLELDVGRDFKKLNHFTPAVKLKLWWLQFGFVLRLLWSLTFIDSPITAIQKKKRTASMYGNGYESLNVWATSASTNIAFLICPSQILWKSANVWGQDWRWVSKSPGHNHKDCYTNVDISLEVDPKRCRASIKISTPGCRDYGTEPCGPRQW